MGFIGSLRAEIPGNSFKEALDIESTMTKWICASCGARHESNNPPCLKCAAETFARVEEDEEVDRVESSIDVNWECTQCNELHLKNNPPCSSCGAMNLEAVYQNQSPSDTKSSSNEFSEPGGYAAALDSSNEQGIVQSAGDILFNKSRVRQLIDLELLIITGTTWIFFLVTELIYHHWRIGREEAEKSQYSYEGGVGEGYITKIAKGIFYLQVAVLGLGAIAIIIGALL